MSISCNKSVAGEIPQLIGDGVSDDTAAIQAMLDSGVSCVYLPPPAKEYLISKTLKIGSNQELKLDRFTVVRLAPNSNCPLLENKGFLEGGNKRLAVTGGIWDYDNIHQAPNQNLIPPEKRIKLDPPKKDRFEFRYEYVLGTAMRFHNVEDISFKGMTIRNPTTYGMKFCRMSYFLIDDITFDYSTWNPGPLNMDGVHLDGFCHHGRISNLRGTCYDDLVALNANDGGCSVEKGPITDIDIDGLYADFCHSAVRILSAPEPVRRVTVRNVHGNFYTYTVGFTHYFPENPRGTFEDMVVEDIFAAKAEVPKETGGEGYRHPMEIIHVEGPVDIKNLVVQRVYRTEKTIPAATVGVDTQSVVENLVVRDSRMVNELGVPIKAFSIRGKVGKLINENNVFIGEWTDTEPVI